ncbi:MAG: hypothetical protein H6686_10160 [Fibrobacteria bacterium]|nr:hypothetical protein [Fibrobacteria bacterium]
MRHILTLLAAATLLSSCNGPWNTEVGDEDVPLNVRVGGFIVAGTAFDTLWLDRTQPFGRAYDSSLAFIDTTRSRVRIHRLDQDQTVEYRMAPGNRRAWLVTDTSARVAWGARYRLEADLVWNASRDFPVRTEWRTSRLRAETYTPTRYDLADTLAAPVEAMCSFLADGLSEDELALIRDRPDSLLRKDGCFQMFPALSAGDLRAVAEGRPVWKLIRTGDSAYLLTDRTEVTDEVGNKVTRGFRQYAFLQRVDEKGFGGILGIQGFDPHGERVIDPVTASFLEALGRTHPDSASFYQKGNSRTTILYGKYMPDQTMFPDTLLFSAVYMINTGRTSLRFYSIDSLYAEYSRTNPDELKPEAYTNVRGGEGFFTGAGSDSIVLHMVRPKSVRGYAIDSLRIVWCEKERDRVLDDGGTWSPGDLCKGVDSTHTSDRKKGGHGPMGG